ncbi:MAG: ABC transporter permease, partial [Alphaproteobacteria bacterium]|nr:ABC transporter permease [Alphaproteobacteria bacterium]
MEPLGTIEIWAGVIGRFWPVWLCMGVIMGASFVFKRRLGLYGRLYDSGVGVIGLGIVLFWVLTAIFPDIIATFNPLEQFGSIKRKPPGTIEVETGMAAYFGGDNLGRDLFSRMVHGSTFVLTVAPAATLVAYMVGIALGLPAGYFGRKID